MASALTPAYQKSLAAALQQISPSLAALHNSRIQEKDPTEAALKCSHCGAFLIPGQGSIRIVRKTRRYRATSTRLKISCHVCRTTDFRPLVVDAAAKAAFEPARTIGRRKTARAEVLRNAGSSALPHPHVLSTPSTPITRNIRDFPTPDLNSPRLSTPLLSEASKSRSQSLERSTSQPLPISPSTSPSPSATPKGASSKKRKKSSLQEMLERNRLQKLQKQEERQRSGLLGFLDSV